MASKFGKFLALTTLAGAACAAVYYFISNGEKNRLSADSDKETGDFFENTPSREYVSLNNDAPAQDTAGTKATLTQKLGEVANELKEKAQEVADGIGLYKKSEAETSDFEFEEFDNETEAEAEEVDEEADSEISEEEAEISAQ